MEQKGGPGDPRQELKSLVHQVREHLQLQMDFGLDDLTIPRAEPETVTPPLVSGVSPYPWMGPGAKRPTLQEVREILGECTRCKLHTGRRHIVFGTGNPRADLVFVGEGPGADEDEQGEPFVGRAGQLLTRMIEAIGLTREEVYIANIIKCFISPRVLIYTAEGYKPIKDIREGDLVLTHNGRFRKVTYIRPRETLPKGSEVVRLTVRSEQGWTRRAVSVTVTPEHPFLVNGEWKRAAELQVGDRIGALGDRCEVCGQAFYTRYDRYERRTFRTCSRLCHNRRMMHGEETGGKVRRTMVMQYVEGLRDPIALTARANERTRQLVARGEAKIQRMTAQERYRGRIAWAANITAGRGKHPIGYGEEELKEILSRMGIDYIHRFAFPGSALTFDFCLPSHKILIEVRGPGFMNPAVQERALLKDRLAEEQGYLIVNLWWEQIVRHPEMVEGILKRLMKNHSGEYIFIDLTVTKVEHRRTLRDFPLYNIGVEEDQSYIVAGLVSHNCRPPGNRAPEADEIASCEPFLIGQLKAIQPKVICALGSVAAQTLLKTKEPISKLRGRLFDFQGIPLLPTFHPAYLLRNPHEKKTAWEDLKLLKQTYERVTGRRL